MVMLIRCLWSAVFAAASLILRHHLLMPTFIHHRADDFHATPIFTPRRYCRRVMRARCACGSHARRALRAGAAQHGARQRCLLLCSRAPATRALMPPSPAASAAMPEPPAAYFHIYAAAAAMPLARQLPPPPLRHFRRQAAAMPLASFAAAEPLLRLRSAMMPFRRRQRCRRAARCMTLMLPLICCRYALILPC
jgi:hypothetical protein